MTEQRLTGGSSNYYKVSVPNPTTAKEPYMTECNDIIEVLQMNFAEGNIFKAIWRMAAGRMNKGKPGTTYLYDAEKIQFYIERILVQIQSPALQSAKEDKGSFDNEISAFAERLSMIAKYNKEKEPEVERNTLCSSPKWVDSTHINDVGPNNLNGGSF